MLGSNPLSRPSGTRVNAFLNPTLKRWAIAGCPSGTEAALFARRRFHANFQGPELKHSRPSPRGIAAGERAWAFEQ